MARLTWRLSDEQLIRRLRFQQRWWRPFWTAMLIVGLLLLAATFWIEPRLWSALSEPGMDFDKLEANAERLVEATPGKKHQVTASTYQEAFVWGLETGNQAALNFGNGALCLGVGYFFSEPADGNWTSWIAASNARQARDAIPMRPLNRAPRHRRTPSNERVSGGCFDSFVISCNCNYYEN